MFAISWGGILLLIGGPGNIPGSKEQAANLFIPALLVMFSGLFIFIYDRGRADDTPSYLENPIQSGIT